jgi:FKBP-type peptidyl-prolyl cis-trans isomerase FkpA
MSRKLAGFALLVASSTFAGAVFAADTPPPPPPPPPAPAAAADPAAALKEKTKELMAKIDADKTVQKTASGLRIHIDRPGQGENPKATDSVGVIYRGTLADGKEFDSSHGTPASFSLGGVIPCWTEGMQMLKPGGKATLYCPPQIAYGDRGYPGVIPSGATLIFEVQLVSIAGQPAAK